MSKYVLAHKNMATDKKNDVTFPSEILYNAVSCDLSKDF